MENVPKGAAALEMFKQTNQICTCWFSHATSAQGFLQVHVAALAVRHCPVATQKKFPRTHFSFNVPIQLISQKTATTVASS